MSLSSK